MTQQIINVGAQANDGTGDPARTAFQKCNSNFTELYSRGITYRMATWGTASGAVLTPATDVPLYIPFASTINQVSILTQGGSGSCAIDIWKTPIGSYPPTSGNSICAGNYVSISSATTVVKTTLTGWTTSVNAGDTLLVHLISTSTFTLINAQIVLTFN